MDMRISIYVVDTDSDLTSPVTFKGIDDGNEGFYWPVPSWNAFVTSVERCLRDLRVSMAQARNSAHQDWEHDRLQPGYNEEHSAWLLQVFEDTQRRVKEVTRLVEWWTTPAEKKFEETEPILRFASVHMMRQCLSEALAYECLGTEPKGFLVLSQVTQVMRYITAHEGHGVIIR